MSRRSAHESRIRNILAVIGAISPRRRRRRRDAGAGGNVVVFAGDDGVLLVEQIRAARPSKEFDARFATENFAPNDVQNSTRWYEQMYNEARTHLGASRIP